MAEERGFEVVDKRRFRADAEPEAPQAESMQAAGDPAPEETSGGTELAGDDLEMAEELEAQTAQMIGSLTVSAVLFSTIQLLNTHAWVAMGLMPNPATGQIQRNMAEARRAIDVVADLVRHLETDLGASEKRELQVLLSNLRLNFVQQSNRPE